MFALFVNPPSLIAEEGTVIININIIGSYYIEMKCSTSGHYALKKELSLY